MSSSKIEVYSRDVEKVPNIPIKGKVQHLFIIYTNSKGIKIILRGGPTNNNIIVDNLYIIKAEYNYLHRNLFPGDYFFDLSEIPSKVIAEGSDAEIQKLVDKMWARAEEINKGNYDYKLPFPGCPSTICHVQNSNTAVKEMVNAAGLTLELPQINGKPVWAPGIDGSIRVTFIDSLMQPQPAIEINNLYIVEGISKEEIASRYSVPIERIYEDTDNELYPKTQGAKPFIIMPESSGNFKEAAIDATGQIKHQAVNGEKLERKFDSPSYHTVAQGENLWNIAMQHGVSVNEILADERNAKFREQPNLIHPQQKIYIPQNSATSDTTSSTTASSVSEQLLNKFNHFSDNSWTGSTDYDGFIKSDFRDFTSFQNNLLKPFFTHAQASYKQDYDYRTGLFKATHSYIHKMELLQLHMHPPGELIYDFVKPGASSESFKDKISFGITQKHILDNFQRQIANLGHNMRTNTDKFIAHQHQQMENYKIKYGDTLSKIANRYGKSINEILEHNTHIKDPNKIFAGHNLRVPRAFPIVVDLGNDQADLIPYSTSHVFYDMTSDEFKENTAWVSNKDALLVYDYNQDGKISETKEVVLTPWDKTAQTDLEALIKYFDDNKDLKFDSKDKHYSQFLLWCDHNLDGEAQKPELVNLKEAGILSFDLKVAGNEEIKEFGKVNYFEVKWAGRVGKAYDIHFKHSLAGIKHNGNDIDIVFNDNKGKIIQIEINKPIFASSISDNAIILGTDEKDTIIASNSPYSLMIKSGKGKDHIITGQGNDWIHCEDSCSVTAGKGDDIIIGSPALIKGGEGYDIFLSTNPNGTEINMALSEIEAFYGTMFQDKVDASTSGRGVFIKTRDGNDEIIGSKFDDIIIPGLGKDTVKAGAGNDIISIDEEDDLNNIKAGAGNDTILIEGSKPVEVNLDILEAEVVIANEQNNIIHLGNDGSYIAYGNKISNQTIHGGSGNNIYVNKGGNDKIFAGTGNNFYYAPHCNGSMEILAADINRQEGKDLVILPNLPYDFFTFRRGLEEIDVNDLYIDYGYTVNNTPYQCQSYLRFTDALTKEFKNIPLGFVIKSVELSSPQPVEKTQAIKDIITDSSGKFINTMQNVYVIQHQLFACEMLKANHPSNHDAIKKCIEELKDTLNNFNGLISGLGIKPQEESITKKQVGIYNTHDIITTIMKDEYCYSICYLKKDAPNIPNDYSKHLVEKTLIETFGVFQKDDCNCQKEYGMVLDFSSITPTNYTTELLGQEIECINQFRGDINEMNNCLF